MGIINCRDECPPPPPRGQPIKDNGEVEKLWHGPGGFEARPAVPVHCAVGTHTEAGGAQRQTKP